MRTTWTEWNPQIMQQAAETEARVAFDDLAPMERDLIATLPYYGAFGEYRDHVVACSVCRDTPVDCPEGGTLRKTARIGLEEQALIAAYN